MNYDLKDFLALNKEYESKPVVPTPQLYTPEGIREHGSTWAERLQKQLGLAGKRVLDIGCGRGGMAQALATKYGCKVCGIDITEYKEWAEWRAEGLQLRVIDITREDHSSLGEFDIIYSVTVWEHIKHPFAALKATREHLSREGKFYLVAHLYRGATGSHLHHEVFFPWPRLLFPDSVVMQFYQHIGKGSQRPPWLSKLTAAEYLAHFDAAGLKADQVWYSVRNIDEEFYTRFEDVLGRYPRFDLERDFIHAILRKA